MNGVSSPYLVHEVCSLLDSLQEFVSDIKHKYEHYEDTFFKTAKGNIVDGK